MKTRCEIIEDLLPLYCDGVCSEESRKTVEEHLKECGNCKKKLDLLSTDFITDNISPDEKKIVKSLSEAVSKIKKKYVLIGCLIAFFAAVIICVSFLGYHFFTSASGDNIEALEKNAEKYLGIWDYSELEIIKTEQRGDYLAALCKDDKGTWTLCVFDRDEIFENRWRAEGGKLGVTPGELTSYNFGDSTGYAVIVAFGGDIPDEVCWYTFENSQTIYYRQVAEENILDVFVFPDIGDINGVPEALDKDKNPIYE